MKSKRIFYCKRCGHEITKAEFKRNGGACDKCQSRDVPLATVGCKAGGDTCFGSVGGECLL